MGQTLLVCKCVQRDKFDYEVYNGSDDILALTVSGSFWVDDGSGRQTVSALEAVCFKEGKTYERKVLEPVQLYLFRFPGGNMLPSGRLSFRDTGRISSTIALLQTAGGSEQNELEFQQALFNDIVNQYRLENLTVIPAAAESDPVIARAIAYINDNLHKKLKLTALAEASYLSYVQFSRRFKAAMGVTVQEYITELRLKKAKTFLGDSDLPVKDVARSCGFANEYYFSNFFREHQSMSPTKFRTLAKSTEKL